MAAMREAFDADRAAGAGDELGRSPFGAAPHPAADAFAYEYVSDFCDYGLLPPAGMMLTAESLPAALAAPPPPAALLPLHQAAQLPPGGGVIRTHSLDYAIEPDSGRLVRFGPAVTPKLARAELPGIAALFSRVQPPAQPRPGAARRRARSQPQLAQEDGEQLPQAPPLPWQQQQQQQLCRSRTPSPSSGGSGSPHARGFGSIVSGVLQAARASGSGGGSPAGGTLGAPHASFKGVRRQPWGVAWTAFLPAEAGQACTLHWAPAERELGSFPDARTAARAHDLALLRLGRAEPADLNRPAASYDCGELRELLGAPLPQLWPALASAGEQAERRSSRYHGVVKAGKTFQARVELE